MEPLYVDTNIEYKLDMTRFPGWDDLAARYQPTLMLHKPDGPCPCNHLGNPQSELYDLLDTSFSLLETNDDDFLEKVIDNLSATPNNGDISSFPNVEFDDLDLCLRFASDLNDVFQDCLLESLPDESDVVKPCNKRKLSNNDGDIREDKRRRFHSDDLFCLLNSVLCDKEDGSRGVSGHMNKEDLCRGS